MASVYSRKLTGSLPRLVGRGSLVLALAAASAPGVVTPANAQSWPYDGRMPDVGAMAYNLTLTQRWGTGAMRMTGYASSRGGMVRWVHCLQQRTSPLRTCQLMVNNNYSNTFQLPANVDLGGWMAMSSGYGWVDQMRPDDGFSSSFESGGSFSMGDWRASGTFRYWQ
jgi:hypothetical protein